MKLRLLATYILCLSTLSASAATMRWINPSGGRWAEPSNWSPSFVPTEHDAAIIDLVGTYTITVDDTRGLGDLVVGAPSGEQEVLISTGGYLSIRGSGSFASNSSLTLSGGTFGGDGPVTIDGFVNWESGTWNRSIYYPAPNLGVTNINGPMTITGPQSKTFSTGIINTNGSVILTGGGPLIFTGSAGLTRWTNLAGGIFDLVDTEMQVGNYSEDRSFANEGTLRKVSSATARIGVPIENSGTIAVSAGTLDLGLDSTSSGSITVSDGAVLRLSGRNAFLPSASLTGNGTVEVIANTTFDGLLSTADLDVSGWFGLNGSATADRVNLSSGKIHGTGELAIAESLTWAGGIMDESGTTTIAAGAVARISGGGVTGDRLLRNYGTVSHVGPFGVSSSGSVRIESVGSWTITGEGGFTGGNGRLTNEGLLSFSANSDAQISAGEFANAGFVRIDARKFTINAPGSDTGRYTIGPGAILGFGPNAFPRSLASTSTVDGGGSIDVRNSLSVDGSISIGGPVSVVNGYLSVGGSITASSLIQSGGYLTLVGGRVSAPAMVLESGTWQGDGTLVGNVTNYGTLTPGTMTALGAIEIVGSYTQTETSTLSINIGASGADRLSISNLASLNGRLQTKLVEPFIPTIGQSWSIVTSAVRDGTFATVQHLDYVSGQTLIPTYGSVSVDLTAVASPVQSITVLPSGTVAAGTPSTFTVTGRDSQGSPTSAFLGTVHFTSSDDRAVLPADYTFTPADNGEREFEITLFEAGMISVSVESTEPSLSGSINVTVAAGPVQEFDVTLQSSTMAAAPVNVTVKARDSYGNRVPGYRGTVTFASTDAAAVLPANYSFTASDQGSRIFAVTLASPGIQTVSVSDMLSPAITGSAVIDVLACTYSLSSTGTSAPSGGMSGTVNMSADAGCPWSAVSDSEWLTTSTSSSGSGSISFVVAENRSTVERVGTISVGDQSFIVTQAGVRPADLVATATSWNRVSLTWSSSDVHGFEVWRDSGSGFVYLASTTSRAYEDSTATANRTFAYKVRAVDVDTNTSPYSNVDLATTIGFSDELLSAGSPIKAAHFEELRMAVNAARALAGLASAHFTDASLKGKPVRLLHLTEIQSALAETRAELDLPPLNFRSIAVRTPVKASDLNQLRDSLR